MYSGSALDTLLNTTFYNTLTTTAKSAIVKKSIIQYSYDVGGLNYNVNTHCSSADYNTKIQNEVVGNRYVYALDVEDIEEYFGGTAGSTSNNTPGVFGASDLRKLFFNTAELVNVNILLRSRATSGNNILFYSNGGASIKYGSCSDTYKARPAFTIDLSKISFTRV